MRIHLLVLIFTFTLFSAYWTRILAQETEVIPLEDKVIRISYWKEKNGLPTWHITDLIRDDRGLIWMGTEIGLVSLDGKNFKTHPVSGAPAVVQNIRRIIIDTEKNLWLFCGSTTMDITILIYDPFQEKTFSLEEYTGTSLKFHHWANAVSFKADSLIWIMDHRNGLGGYFGPDRRWHEMLRVPPNEERRNFFIPAQNQHIWNLNFPAKTLNLIDRTGAILEHYPLPANAYDFDMRVGQDGYCYIMYLIKGQKEKHRLIFRCEISRGPVPVPTVASYTLKWRTLSNNGFKIPPVWSNNAAGISLILDIKKQLIFFDQNQPFYQGLEVHFQKNNINAFEHRIFALNDGSFWMIGIGALIRIEVADNYFTRYFKDFPEPPSMRGIATNSTTLYANSYKGLFEIDLKTLKYKIFNNSDGRGLTLKNDTLWISQQGGNKVWATSLSQKQHQTFDLRKLNGEHEEVYIATTGEVYVGTLKGVLYKTAQDTAFELLPQIAGGTFHKNNAGLWIGGAQGLWLLDNQNQVIKHYKNEISYKGMPPSAINHIHEDASGIFWMATNEGLWRWNPLTADLKIYDKKTANLSTNFLHAVHEDRYERLWISSQNGLLCFNKKKNTFRTFTTVDGLPSNEFNLLSHYQDHSDRLYFGGVSGLISFHPDSLSELPGRELSIQLLGLYLKHNHSNSTEILTHEAISGDKTLEISHHSDEFIIHFCVPSFLREPVQYRWRILEIDSTWHYLDEPRFTLFHLPSGSYPLELDAAIIGNSAINIPTLRLSIHKERPVYLRNWFLTLVTCFILALMVFIHKWRQRHLRNLSRRLAVEVAEKTVQLQQERDLIAKQAATLAQLDEEKTRFFQDLSHELRNPLTLIIGPVGDFLKQDDLPAHYRDRMERIHRNAKKILQLVNEVLELTKLEAGVVPVEKGVAPLASFVARICQDFESVAQHKGISLTLTHTLPPDLEVETDIRKVEKILVNLIQNAFKFTPAGGAVEVNAQWTPDKNLKVEVRDTGIGIAAEHLSKVFERYFQIPANSDQPRKGGFGIGLAMCRYYTNLLGGTIDLESTVGQGTTMRFLIPCKQVNRPDVSLLDPADTAAYSDLLTYRILLVDDEPEILSYFSEQLEPRYRVLKAANIKDAFQLMQTQKLDLVICDQNMPGGTGLEFLAQLRHGSESFQQVPFVLLTGAGTKEVIVGARRLNATMILHKPITAEELSKIVQNILFSQTISV